MTRFARAVTIVWIAVEGVMVWLKVGPWRA